jgi:rRNA maturation protein Rpf1
MSYNLFLDDIRHPNEAYIDIESDSSIRSVESLKKISGIENDQWVIARDYDEFVFLINQLGIPLAISFDHDLQEEHIKYYYNVTQVSGVIEYENFKNKTGKHCADYFVEKFKNTQEAKAPKIFVHSANAYGAKRIKKVLKQIND